MVESSSLIDKDPTTLPGREFTYNIYLNGQTITIKDKIRHVIRWKDGQTYITTDPECRKRIPIEDCKEVTNETKDPGGKME